MSLRFPPSSLPSLRKTLLQIDQGSRDLVLLTKKQVADLVQTSERSIQRRIDEGALSSIAVGNQVRVSVSDLERFLEENRRQVKVCSIETPTSTMERPVRDVPKLGDVLVEAVEGVTR